VSGNNDCGLWRVSEKAVSSTTEHRISLETRMFFAGAGVFQQPAGSEFERDANVSIMIQSRELD
jgi:hypothetical protein